jgi:hypothetical protein
MKAAQQIFTFHQQLSEVKSLKKHARCLRATKADRLFHRRHTGVFHPYAQRTEKEMNGGAPASSQQAAFLNQSFLPAGNNTVIVCHAFHDCAQNHIMELNGDTIVGKGQEKSHHVKHRLSSC